MRFMVAEADGTRGVYVIEGEKAFCISSVNPELGPDLMPIVSGGEEAMEAVRQARSSASVVDVGSLTPALPIARPGKVICLGLNYADHAKEGGHEVPDYPALFMRGATSLIPSGAPIIRPSCSERLDYEVELMIVVGKTGRHISEADSLDHIFGYTAFNDASVRDYQRKTAQWTPGKNFDATGPTGPVVVTADELPPGARDLHVETRLNGEVLQSATTSDMMFTVPRTMAILSEYSTLEAGDLIAMGTPKGVGHARKPPLWMRPGDVVEVEIEGIGICRNPIVAEESL
jgi:2-keto-4-pentenoate hydratase/2-oxohepta-3-ene-1,7-dioic acid hydratase in catechol pathway